VPLTEGHFQDEVITGPAHSHPVRIIKEVWIRSKSEIQKDLEAIFDHLFVDLITKKRPPKKF
jgi:hypothetical protein